MQTIQTNEQRKKFVSPTEPKQKNLSIEDKYAPFENHVWNNILAWTNVNNNQNPLANRTNIYLPVVTQIRPETIEKWRNDLENSGYNFEIQNRKIIISMKL